MITVALSSNSSSFTQTLSSNTLQDNEQITINLSNIYKSIVPLYLKIDWGDGESEIYDNEMFKRGRTNSNLLLLPTVFDNTPTKRYLPSTTSLYKRLSAQVLVQYSNGNQNYYVLPLLIRNKSLVETLQNSVIENCNFIDPTQEIQINTDNGLFEIIIPPTT